MPQASLAPTSAPEVQGPQGPHGPHGPLLELGGVVHGAGLADLATRLHELHQLAASDMAETERDLALLDRPVNVVAKSAHHLLALGGKRLRPMCVALAAHTGAGFSRSARKLACAVELVHAATLLHDDVVDLGETRRGKAAARTIYGNAASIFAGDWLLVAALKLVRQAEVPGTLDRLLAVIEEMIFAEAVQLENRGRLGDGRRDYFKVVEGKTAALFRWAMYAGGRAGDLGEDGCRALEGYGLHVGVAFQAMDDLLDFTADEATLGKAPLADLREGKLTYPLIVALERDPTLVPVVRDIAALAGDEPPPPVLCARVVDVIRKTGGFEACRELARGRTHEAITCLAAVPPGPARAALVTVAEAMLAREK
jgi:octaprenyl-diphosphate synthase